MWSLRNFTDEARVTVADSHSLDDRVHLIVSNRSGDVAGMLLLPHAARELAQALLEKAGPDPDAEGDGDDRG